MKFTFTTFIILIQFVLLGCSHTSMTEKPREYVTDPGWRSEQNGISTIDFKIAMPNSEIDKRIREIEKMRFSEQQEEEIVDVPLTGKTENPLYNPNKWIKTKNPFYNPKKWLKACAFGGCIKTKNPAYDPKKWFKTKNPAYSPNKWIEIEAMLSTIQGYQVSAWVDDEIDYEPYGGNKFDITIPVATEGKVTLVTPIPPPLYNNPFRGSLDMTGKFGFDVLSNWCLKGKVSLRPRWRNRLELDLTHGLYLLSLDMTDQVEPMLKQAEKDIREDLDNAFDCSEIRKLAGLEWKTRTLQVDENQWAVFQPISASMSHLRFTNEEVAINGRITAKLSIVSDVSDVSSLPNVGPLPNLELIDSANPAISLNIPVEVPYSRINRELLSALNANPPLIGKDGDVVSGRVLVSEIDAYPSGNDIVLKAKFETVTNKAITNVKATAYFKGSLAYRQVDMEGKKIADSSVSLFSDDEDRRHIIDYDLKKISFSDFGNGKDALVLGLAYSALKDQIESPISMDITPTVNAAIDGMRQSITQLAIDLNAGDAGNEDRDDRPIDNVQYEFGIDDWAYINEGVRFVLSGSAELE